RPCRFDGHKTIRRSGALRRTAGVAFDPENLGAGARQEEKRKRPCRFDGHKTIRRSGALRRTAGVAFDPENLG
ncbi:hypothetical protein ACI767_16725, partial [Planococcus plakortidis]